MFVPIAAPSKAPPKAPLTPATLAELLYSTMVIAYDCVIVFNIEVIRV